MSDEKPPIHIAHGERWDRICFNSVVKWAAGLAATLIGALLIGAFSFAWQSNRQLHAISRDIEALNHKVDTATSENKRRIERLEDKRLAENGL